MEPQTKGRKKNWFKRSKDEWDLYIKQKRKHNNKTRVGCYQNETIW